MTREDRAPLIGAVFGLVYVVVNAGSLSSAVALPLRILAVIAFVGLVVALRRRPGKEGSGVQFGRGYRLVVLGEVVAAVVGYVVIATAFDAKYAPLAWITTVVGVHFVLLAVVWREAFFHLLGGLLAACGVVGLILAAIGHGSDAAIPVVAAVAPGLILLTSSYRVPLLRRTAVS